MRVFVYWCLAVCAILSPRLSYGFALNEEDTTTQVNEGTGTLISCKFIPGDLLLTPPVCVLSKPGCIECFYVSSVSHTVRAAKRGTCGDELVDLKGVNILEVTAASQGDGSGVVHVVARDGINTIYLNSRIGETWTDWTKIGGPIMEVPALITTGKTDVEGYYRSSMNTLSRIYNDEGTWKTNEGLTKTPLIRSVECINSVSGDVDCISSNADNELLHLQEIIKDGEWTEEDVPGAIHGHPSLPVTDFSLYVCGVATENRMLCKVKMSTRWLDWGHTVGTIYSDPVCFLEDYILRCFALGFQSDIIFTSFVKAEWTPWASIGYAVKDRPSCVAIDSTSFNCYSRGYTHELVEAIIHF